MKFFVLFAILASLQLHAEDKIAAPAAPSTPAQESENVSSENLSLENKDGMVLTLEDSIKKAITEATLVLKAENDVHDYGARLLQAYGQFLPNLVAAGTYGGQHGNTYYTTAAPTFVSGNNVNATFSLTADLNIFNGLSDFSNLRSSILSKEAADLTFKRAQQEISLDVAQSFLQVILDNKLVQIAKKNLQASQERERLLKAQTDVGQKNLSDLFRQQAQTSQDEFLFLESQNRVRRDQISLLRKLRLDVNLNYHFVEPTLSEQVNATKLPTETILVDQALQQRMDLKASNNVSDARDWDIHSAFGNYLPKLDLMAGLSSVGHRLDSQTVNGVSVMPPTQDGINDQLHHQKEYSIGLTLTWTIFDRFLTHENVSHARAIASDAAIDARDRKLQVQGEVRQAYGNYLTAVQQLNTSKKGFEAAQKAYEVTDGRYSVGAASFLDLITSQSTLVQAESQHAQAVINYQLQDRSLAFAIGNLATL